MTKNVFGGRVETTVTAEKNASMTNIADICKKCNYFNQQPCDFSMETANLPDNIIFYINQAYLYYKDNQKLFYCDYYMLRQVN